jgi:hypothetical protein
MNASKSYSPGSAYSPPRRPDQMRQAQWDALLSLEEGTQTPQIRWWLDPARIMTDAGLTPDPWQRQLLECEDAEVQIMAGRQVGKSQGTGAVALMTALREKNSLTLLLSPTARQSGELLADKVLPLYRAVERDHPTYLAGAALTRQLVTSLEFANGSRIIALPENPDGIRGYSGVALLVIDEASFVADALYHAARPMLATSRGRIVLLSTPKGKRGFFFHEWEKGEGWKRFLVPSASCPRITAEFLARERARLGERAYAEEFECVFNDAVGQVFSQADIDAAFTHAGTPIDLGLGGQ